MIQKYCLGIGEFDEWGQISLIKLFKKYAVAYFHPSLIAKSVNDQYPADVDELKHDEKTLARSKDYLDLLLKSTSPLIVSSNPAIALELCDSYLSLSISTDEVMQADMPMLLLLLSFLPRNKILNCLCRALIDEAEFLDDGSGN